MSALGHKRTYAVQKGMSALPPKATAKADIGALNSEHSPGVISMSALCQNRRKQDDKAGFKSAIVVLLGLLNLPKECGEFCITQSL